MSAAEAARPQPMARETFEAFWISETPLSGLGMMKPLFESAATLAELVETATARTSHQAKFAIRHTDTLTGKSMVHFYIVRKRSRGVARYSDYQTRVIHDRYAEPLFVLDGASMAAIGGGL